MACTSPYVKTRGEKKGAKQQKVSGNALSANDADRPTGDNTGVSMSMAALAGKLDVIMERLDKLDVLGQLAAQVASLSTSLEFCHASIAELKAENESLRTQVATITRDTDERRRQAASNHDAVVDLQWRSMRDNLVFYGIREETDENCNTVLASFSLMIWAWQTRSTWLEPTAWAKPHQGRRGQSWLSSNVTSSARRWGWLDRDWPGRSSEWANRSRRSGRRSVNLSCHTSKTSRNRANERGSLAPSCWWRGILLPQLFPLTKHRTHQGITTTCTTIFVTTAAV